MTHSNNLENKLDPEYVLIVEEAAKKEENFDIYNSSIEHAVFLSRKLISKAKGNIKILTGELSGPYYDKIECDLTDAAEKLRLARKNNSIRIIIWDKNAEENPNFNKLLESYPDIVTLKKANQPDINRISHFLVSDSFRYRLEKMHTKKELQEGKVRAVANFNNPDQAKILNESFDNIWSQLESRERAA